MFEKILSVIVCVVVILSFYAIKIHNIGRQNGNEKLIKTAAAGIRVLILVSILLFIVNIAIIVAEHLV